MCDERDDYLKALFDHGIGLQLRRINICNLQISSMEEIEIVNRHFLLSLNLIEH
jgi:hypothetical protein